MTTTLQPTTPSGLASQQVAELIAQSAIFQQYTGYSEDEAAAFVHEGWYAIGEEPQKSCAIIYPGETDPIVLGHGGTLPRGNMMLDLWLWMDGSSPVEEERRFANFHEGLAELLNSYDGAGYTFVCRPTQPPAQIHPGNVAQSEPSAWFAQYTITWGPWR